MMASQSPSDPRKVTQLQGLTIALRHPAVATDQQNICRLLQVCKAWRSTVQQLNAGLTDVVVCDSASVICCPAEQPGSVLLCFSSWLPVYAGTVRSIRITNKKAEKADTYAAYRHASRGQQLLASCLQAAHAAPRTPGSAAAASAGDTTAAIEGAAVATTLQLQSFTCPMMLASPEVISSLPAATLTKLDVSIPSQEATASYHTALQQLSNLRSLQFACSGFMGERDLQFVQHLSQLTKLHLGRLNDNRALQLLPLQLQTLQFEYSRDGMQPCELKLSHLTQLQQLTALVLAKVAQGATLPQQLQQLWLQYTCTDVISVFKITALQQLKQLAIFGGRCSAQDVLSLTSLLQLQEFKFTCVAFSEDLAVLPLLPKLPIVDLSIMCSADDLRTEHLLHSLAALTGLTGLRLQCLSLQAEDDDDDDAELQIEAEDGRIVMRICEPMKHLTNLRNLFVSVATWNMYTQKLDEHDLLNLRPLTKLTKLCLYWGDRVPGAVAVAVLGELTGLQHLEWSTLNPREGNRVSAYNGVSHALPVIGKLSGLTSLSLHGLSHSEQRFGAQYLTNLRNMQHVEGI